MTDGETLTIDDEIMARARIHAREVVRESDLSIDLDAIEWDVSTRAKRRAGACRWNSRTAVATIVLTRRAYERYEWAEFAGVVRHELVHAWEYQQFGESGHGRRFRERAAELDAPRHCRTFSEPRYVLRCLEAGCEWTASRHRASRPVKSPGRYRCGSCGGSYEVEHAESGRTWTSASEYGGIKSSLGDEW
ncbi:SprT-like domain-containing protein [Natrialbaceae archaeon A-arb3/5]